MCLSALPLVNGIYHLHSQLIGDSMNTSNNHVYPKVNKSKQLQFIPYYSNKNEMCSFIMRKKKNWQDFKTQMLIKGSTVFSQLESHSAELR